ncbi:hypothetical protein BH20VER3_BH20VER3_00940 [soil metagenome]
MAIRKPLVLKSGEIQQLQSGDELAVAGVTDGSNAAAGKVGEYLSSVVASGSGVSLTSGAVANITSLALTAGDWDVWAQGGIVGVSGSTVTFFFAATSANNNNIPEPSSLQYQCASFTIGANAFRMAIVPQRVSLAAAAIYYLNVGAVFGGTMKGFGNIHARRRR